ncbi:MAG TPA: asparagine synthase [Gammaproteobacteria bacterium]|nr:asparagine synthase [Gammaproteobacteria bacterium]
MRIICGWLGKNSESQAALIKKMLAAATGYADAPPIGYYSEHGVIGICNGQPSPELYSSEEICAVIEGHPRWEDPFLAQLAKEENSSHAVAEGFRRYGLKVLDKLHGDFALCIMKPAEGYVLLAIDRVGIHPLAYTLTNGVLVFGSQISSILLHPSVTAAIDPQGVFNYLYFHMIPSPGTIFQDIHKLQPGEFLEYDKGKIKRKFYWQLEFSEERESEKKLASQLRSELEQSVGNCLSGQETGTFLSGGLDSSTITGIYQGFSEKPVDAYVIGFDAEGFDEIPFARSSARHFGATLHEYYVTPQDVLDAIPLISSAYDEPFGNASAIPAYYCARLARQQGKTMLLAGDGGDEIFAGNARYAKQKVFDLYKHIPSILKSTLVEPVAASLSPLKKLKSYIDQANVPMPERMETYNFLHRSTLSEIFNKEFLDQIDPESPLTLLKLQYERTDASTPLVKKMLFLDHKFTLADNDLRKVNRMCELAGIDVRYPLLQDSMMSFASRIPADMLMHRFELRSFYRHAMKGFLADDTLSKSKHGFGLPFGVWMNEYKPLKDFVHDNLQKFRQREILNTQYIDKILEAQLTGHATYYGVFIWVLVMFEEWLQTHNQ